MEETSTRIPEDFNPYLAADALKGISEAIYWFITEGPACEQPMPPGAHASLVGLSWAGRNLARQLHEYFRRLDESGIELPRGVEESPSYYAMN